MEAWGLWYSGLGLHQLGSRPTVFIPRWTTHPCILYQVCVTRGVMAGVGHEAWISYLRHDDIME